MKVGVLLGGDTTVRAAHSMAADPAVDSVVVVGPATSRSFEVVEDPSACDILVGSGPDAPRRARLIGLPLVWDGPTGDDGVRVWGASPLGLALAMAARERKTDLVAVAHPEATPGSSRSVRFPRPVGATGTDPMDLGPTTVYLGRSYNEFAACLVSTKSRQLTVVDHGSFMSGIALGAAVSAAGDAPRPVWDAALTYLETATGMGLVMAEA